MKTSRWPAMFCIPFSILMPAYSQVPQPAAAARAPTGSQNPNNIFLSDHARSIVLGRIKKVDDDGSLTVLSDKGSIYSMKVVGESQFISPFHKLRSLEDQFKDGGKGEFLNKRVLIEYNGSGSDISVKTIEEEMPALAPPGHNPPPIPISTKPQPKPAPSTPAPGSGG